MPIGAVGVVVRSRWALQRRLRKGEDAAPGRWALGGTALPGAGALVHLPLDVVDRRFEPGTPVVEGESSAFQSAEALVMKRREVVGAVDAVALVHEQTVDEVETLAVLRLQAVDADLMSLPQVVDARPEAQLGIQEPLLPLEIEVVKTLVEFIGEELDIGVHGAAAALQASIVDGQKWLQTTG